MNAGASARHGVHPGWVRGWNLVLDDGLPRILREWLADAFMAFEPPDDSALRPARVQWASQVDALQGPISRKQVQAGGVELEFVQPVPASPVAEPIQFELIDRDAASGCNVAVCSSEVWSLSCWGPAPQAAVYLAITECFRSQAWLSLHASASVDPGEAVRGARLVLGRSGAGKSCDLLAHLQQGCLPLGEDRVWVDARTLLAVARDTSIRVHPSMVRMFPMLQGCPSSLHADGKLCIDLDDLAVIPSAPARVIRVLEARQATPRSPLALTQLLWQAAGLPLTAQGRHWVQHGVSRLLALALSTPAISFDFDR
jgi:hypothetical protein